MKIGIIGAGKVGVTLGKYLADAAGGQQEAAGPLDFQVLGFYSRTLESAASAAEFTGTQAYEHMNKLVEASDTLFVAVPDGAVAQVWDCIAKNRLSGKIICHFSGSLSSHVFSGIEQSGASGCSIHPMYAFSDKFTSCRQFHTARLTMEGGQEAVSVMKQLFEGLGHTVYTVRSEQKGKYHTAASLASNYMVGLFQISLRLLGECGFCEREAAELLGPLVLENAHAMLEKGPAEALTGPVERCDAETVKMHLNVLSGRTEEQIYRILGQELIAIAKQKNPERDYTALENIL
ncbi:MAG: DUF2520 domain-containing protein [Clostridiaceae bacterium]|nr:DUF2520 domain-containing protein [Clostridiaceae bacterium]